MRVTMNLFIDILTKVTLPIITLVALGWLLQGRLKLDIGTLNRVQVYVVMPAFLMHFLSAGKAAAVGDLAGVLSRHRAVPVSDSDRLADGDASFASGHSLGPMMGLGTAYANVGFFGIPVTQLAFGSEYLIYQSVMTALMSVLVCTVGVWLLAPPGNGGRWGKFKTVFETPLIPAVFLGLALRGFQIELPPLISQPLQFLGSIFTPLALYTLGAQVAASKITRFEFVPQIMILLLKFLLAPALTWALCSYMGLPRDVSDVIVVAAATPVGVLITIFAAEYKTEPEFISTAVVVTTALSPIFVTAWILATRMY